MSPTFISVIVVGIVSLLIVWYINTNLDRLKKRKLAKIAQHKDCVTRFQRLYDRIPDNYLSTPIKLLLLNELIDHLQQWHRLDSESENVQQHLNKRLQQKQTAIQSATKPRITDTNDSDEAAELRRRLMELHKFIVMAKKSRKLSKSEAQNELQLIKALFVETGTNTFSNLAKQALDQKNNRLAIHYYGRALTEYQKSNNEGRFNNRIQELQALIKQIQGKPATNANGKKSEPAPNALDQAMDELLAESEGEKKVKF